MTEFSRKQLQKPRHMRHAAVPEVIAPWWTIATSPDLGLLGSSEQRVMDFSLWQAADQTWQLGACVKDTGCGGNGRLLYRWQADLLTDVHWSPMGVLLQAEEAYEETPGGLQAPFVSKHEDSYCMFYGDWMNICIAQSADGKSFYRRCNVLGGSQILPLDSATQARDPMLFSDKNRHLLYFTEVREGRGAIVVSISTDLCKWSVPTVVSRGGSGGDGPNDAECAHVCQPQSGGDYYLFRWHSAGITNVYCSSDPLDFGVDHDRKKIAELPLEVARVVASADQLYISSLHSDLTGIKLARMRWRMR